MATAKSKAAEKITLNDEQKSELISLWEGEEVLYNIEDADYRDNAKRLAASKRIAELMSVTMTYLQVNTVTKSAQERGERIFISQFQQ